MGRVPFIRTAKPMVAPFGIAAGRIVTPGAPAVRGVATMTPFIPSLVPWLSQVVDGLASCSTDTTAGIPAFASVLRRPAGSTICRTVTDTVPFGLLFTDQAARSTCTPAFPSVRCPPGEVVAAGAGPAR